MSLEAWGDEGSGFDVEILYNAGWFSNEDCTEWWLYEDEEHYTLEEAIQIYESSLEEWNGYD